MNENINLVQTSDNLKETNVLKRNMASVIDAAIIIALFIGITRYLPETILAKLKSPIRPEFYILILLAFYRLVSIFLFNGTIGMLICRIKLLNSELGLLSSKEKTLAAFFILINGVDYYDKKN